MTPQLGQTVQTRAQLGRETAHPRHARNARLACAARACQSWSAGTGSSSPAPAKCQHRYPSPRRSAAITGRPATGVAALVGGISTVIAYQERIALEFGSVNADSTAAVQPKESKTTCAKHLFSSPPPLCSVWPAALSPISSVDSPALPVVPSLPMPWVSTRRPVRLRAPRAACCATMRASAAAQPTKQHAPAGALHHTRPDRRPGCTPAAVFRWKDQGPCSRRS